MPRLGAALPNPSDVLQRASPACAQRVVDPAPAGFVPRPRPNWLAAKQEVLAALLQARGMSAVQAKPVKQAEGAAANHLGPLAMYMQAGFSVVRETEDGDVFVRKDLASSERSCEA